MTLTQIKYFLVVAECLNFTKAAEQVFVTQQVISKQIKHIEEEIGFSLFVRDKRNVKLTDGGQMLYGYWSKMLNGYNKVLKEAYTIMNQKEQIMRIGTIDVSRIYDWIAHAVAVMSEDNPLWQFRVDSGSYRNLYQGLIEGRYDCIISLQDENRGLPEEFEEVVVYHSAPKLIIAQNHPAYHEGMSLEEMKDYPLYAFSSKFSKNAIQNIRKHCISVGIDPQQIEEFDEISSMEMALHAGKGYAVTYELYFRNPVGNLKIIDVSEEQARSASDFSIAYAKSKKKILEPFLDAFPKIFE